jgi:hypothetical protein
MTDDQALRLKWFKPAEYAAWLRGLRTFLAEKPSIFECDCEPSYEPDTNAWNHADKCATWQEDHADIVLREAADLIERLAAEATDLRILLKTIRLGVDEGSLSSVDIRVLIPRSLFKDAP